MPDLFFDRTTAVLGKVLDGTASRQRVLAENIANADTPGYTRQDVTFEGALRDALTRPTPDPHKQVTAIEDVAIDTTADTASPRRVDGNNVNMEREMVAVAKNSLQYESSAQMLTMKLRVLKLAIHEGRR